MFTAIQKSLRDFLTTITDEYSIHGFRALVCSHFEPLLQAVEPYYTPTEYETLCQNVVHSLVEARDFEDYPEKEFCEYADKLMERLEDFVLKYGIDMPEDYEWFGGGRGIPIGYAEEKVAERKQEEAENKTKILVVEE